MASNPVQVPAGFVPAVALAFGTPPDAARFVDSGNPLPVSVTPAPTPPATSTPVVGTASVTTDSPTFTPNLGRPINLTLSGTWTGSVAFQRSTDGGANWRGVTVGGVAWGVFTANCNEPVWEPTESGGTFRLAITRTTGTIDYRIAQ